MTKTDSKATIQQLTQPVQFLKGVGPHRAELLEKLGLRTAADMLFFFPRKYQDFTQQSEIDEIVDDELVSVVGTIDDIDHTVASTGKHVLYVLLRRGNQFLRAVWFNQPFLVHKFQIGQRVMFLGKARMVGGRFQMSHPTVTWIQGDDSAVEAQQLLPVYRLTDGINQRQIREMVARTVDEYAPLVEEAIPNELRGHAAVCDIGKAIRQIHAPANFQEVEDARGRLVYQELLILQLALAIRRHRVRTSSVARHLEMTPKIRARILRRLPFELTKSQVEALDAIADDLNRPYPMNRLLHGDVGSGKTAVAVCSMLVAVAHGCQAALMAPTEILAGQHFRSITELLAGSRVRIELLTGSLKSAQRKKLNQAIAAGEVDIVVGTQAVASSKVEFNQLGLVVIDEQHKFGVKRRASLKQSGHDPHYLVMTATPIPRTVSMTLFGDLDMSVLERPENVGSIVNTYLGDENTRDEWWKFFTKKLRDGRQGFVVAPLVDSGDESNLGSAERLYESLANGPLEEFRLDVLHGRQTAEEKELALRAFADGQTQVIVATGVVEVGINVPNATVMTIESAERFGLSQLHQLRGRISRGTHPGFVCAFTSSDDQVDNERLKAFVESNDGFKLAETDLRLRGPGNLFSTQQTGFPPLMIADLIRDEKILSATQQDARRIISQDPDLSAAEYQRLRRLVFARYGKALDLSDVG